MGRRQIDKANESKKSSKRKEIREKKEERKEKGGEDMQIRQKNGEE